MKFKLDFNLDRNPTLAQIRSLPTASRYGLIALTILAAYFAVDSWSWNWARAWNLEADRIQKILSDSAKITANSSDTPAIGPETFGPVFPIGSESEGAQSMATAVVEIVKKIFHHQFQLRRATRQYAAFWGVGQRRKNCQGKRRTSVRMFSRCVLKNCGGH
jgi:hypothetical protein